MIFHSKPFIDNDDLKMVSDQLLTRQIAKGELTSKFEYEISKFTGFKYCFTTSNGTSAIYIALKALNIGEGDEVILPCYVCKNVRDAVLLAGAIPVLCDIGSFWCVEKLTVQSVISNRTKAIIAVHTMGIKCDIPSLLTLNIPIIEDACQFFSNELNCYHDLVIPHVVIFSFNATKCLTTGEGGCLATSNDEISHNVKNLLHNKAFAPPLTDIQSALGLSQLEKYSKFLAIRKELATMYFDMLADSLTNKFRLVSNRSINFRFLIDVSESNSFDKFKKYMELNGVSVRKGVDNLLSFNSSAYPVSVKTFNRTISLPIYPELKSENISYISNKINEYEFV